MSAVWWDPWEEVLSPLARAYHPLSPQNASVSWTVPLWPSAAPLPPKFSSPVFCQAHGLVFSRPLQRCLRHLHAFFHRSVCKCLSLSSKPLPLLSEPGFSRLSPKVASSLLQAFPGLLRTTIFHLPCSLTTLVSSCYLLTRQSP